MCVMNVIISLHFSPLLERIFVFVIKPIFMEEFLLAFAVNLWCLVLYKVMSDCFMNIVCKFNRGKTEINL